MSNVMRIWIHVDIFELHMPTSKCFFSIYLIMSQHKVKPGKPFHEHKIKIGPRRENIANRTLFTMFNKCIKILAKVK